MDSKHATSIRRAGLRNTPAQHRHATHQRTRFQVVRFQGSFNAATPRWASFAAGSLLEVEAVPYMIDPPSDYDLLEVWREHLAWLEDELAGNPGDEDLIRAIREARYCAYL